eukprot:7124864-Alexandrium_andersonii.AAC.1
MIAKPSLLEALAVGSPRPSRRRDSRARHVQRALGLTSGGGGIARAGVPTACAHACSPECLLLVLLPR